MNNTNQDTKLMKGYLSPGSYIFKVYHIKKLLKKGFDPNSSFNKWHSFFTVVVRNGLIRVVKLMIKYGANINQTDKEGKNAFLLACESGSLKTVKYFLKKGFDINSVTKNNENGLMLSTALGNSSLIRFFSKKGLDINAKNKKGETALIVSISTENTIYSGSGRELEKYKKQRIGIFSELIKYGADININDKSGNTILSHVVSRGHLSLIEYLVKKGANVNASKFNLLSLAEGIDSSNYIPKKDIKAFIKSQGVEPEPITVCYTLRVVCKECRRYIPMNGPFEKVKCDHCLTETKFSELDEFFWGRIIENSFQPENSGSLENTFKVDMKWSNPQCSKCDFELDISDYNFESEDPVICKKCGYKNKSYPAPAFLKEYEFYDVKPQLKPQQIFCAEKEDENKEIDQEEIKPIAFNCESCTAALAVTKNTPRNWKCGHCGTKQNLPEPIWKALHPVKKRQKWYIRFA